MLKSVMRPIHHFSRQISKLGASPCLANCTISVNVDYQETISCVPTTGVKETARTIPNHMAEDSSWQPEASWLYNDWNNRHRSKLIRLQVALCTLGGEDADNSCSDVIRPKLSTVQDNYTLLLDVHFQPWQICVQIAWLLLLLLLFLKTDSGKARYNPLSRSDLLIPREDNHTNQSIIIIIIDNNTNQSINNNNNNR